MKTKHDSARPPAGQSSDQTLTSRLGRKCPALALGAFLFSSVFALSPSSVEAECKEWDVSGPWRFKQGPTNVEVDIVQNGIVLTGKANHRPTGTTNVRGTVDGYVKRDFFSIKIHWKNNTTGAYTGTIKPSGRIEGIGYNVATPSAKVNWYSTGLMQCADAANAAQDSEKARQAAEQAANDKAAANEAAKAPPPVLSAPGGEAGKKTRPFVRALPQIVSIPPGDKEAVTKIVWFAGNDHPNAQLVVAVNGGDERPVDPQRKGSRQVKVKAGEKYVYTLSDAGESLASVIVQTDQPAAPDRQRLRGNQTEPPQDGESDKDENQEEE